MALVVAAAIAAATTIVLLVVRTGAVGSYDPSPVTAPAR
jgi:hypothetical protein